MDVKREMLLQLYDAGYTLKEMQEKKFGWWSDKSFKEIGHGCLYNSPKGLVAITVVGHGLIDYNWDDVKLIGEVTDYYCKITGPNYIPMFYDFKTTYKFTPVSWNYTF